MPSARSRPSGHSVQDAAAGRLGIGDRLLDAVAELPLAPGQRRQPALARRPVAGRHIEQGLDEAVAAQPLGDLGRWIIVGEQILDRLEAAAGGGFEAVEEIDFLEQKAQIGGEFRHVAFSRANAATLSRRPAKDKPRRSGRPRGAGYEMTTEVAGGGIWYNAAAARCGAARGEASWACCWARSPTISPAPPTCATRSCGAACAACS